MSSMAAGQGRNFISQVPIVLSLLFLVTPLGCAKFMKTRHSYGAFDSQTIRSEVAAALQEALGHGHGVTPQILSRIEGSLGPILYALPKNEHGRWGEEALRYAVHRYFEREHGWVVKGFAPHSVASGASRNSSDYKVEREEGVGSDNSTGNLLEEDDGFDGEILEQKLPGYVEQVLERKLVHQGFDLEDAVTMVVALRRLIFDESMTILERAFALNGRMPNSRLQESALRQVAVSFMMLYMNQLDEETNDKILAPGSPMSPRLLNKLARHHSSERQDVLAAHPKGWRPGDWVTAEVRGAVENTWQKNPFVSESARRGRSHGFDQAVKAVVEPVVESFGKWHNEECVELKDLLTSMDRKSTGRVRYAEFYGKSLGKWHLAEPVEYLRSLGALDETSTSKGPQVLIPNYVLSLSNCVEPSSYYSVCCLNECEGLLATLEREIGRPVATADEIAQVISNIETSSMETSMGNLTGTLMAQLNEVAEFHKGKIPLHGRLLAQWLHYAFPRECPFPHKRGDLEPMGAAAWMDAGNNLPASSEEVAAIREQILKEDELLKAANNRKRKERGIGAQKPPTVEEDHEVEELMGQWTLEEEMMMNMTVAFSKDDGIFGSGLFAPIRECSLPKMVVILVLGVAVAAASGTGIIGTPLGARTVLLSDALAGLSSSDSSGFGTTTSESAPTWKSFLGCAKTGKDVLV